MSRGGKKITLSPLSFEEAVTDILKVKPEPRHPKRVSPGNMAEAIKQYVVRSFHISTPDHYAISPPMPRKEAEELVRVVTRDPNFRAEIQEYIGQKAGEY